MPDLETRVVNRLQEKKAGQTAEQLAEHFGTLKATVLIELKHLERMGHTRCVGGDTIGVWTLTGH